MVFFENSSFTKPNKFRKVEKLLVLVIFNKFIPNINNRKKRV